ncbi:class I SAM-dependent methyltransferase [Rhodohalobacter sp. SW132]|uniref:class I SAM-dependent methyltransferase n=1 Tax=Rhodohalobacter sp. SW132 TaxID=2293433 RepID=UPI000E21F0F5|nr:class I SAM-dependent methyltransferase [Rhodohalobacter sp. SW132]REL39197.1 class I SAM-dependent methyltransferase [Rhodohalobacter sp. SW132]
MKDLEFIASQLRKPSGDFAATIAEKMNEGNQPLYDLTFNRLDLNKGDTILEIGFGNGFHFPELLSLEDSLTVYGIDYSEDMVRQAAGRNKKLIKKGQLFLAEGGSDRLPYADHTFDIVFCNMVIYFWDNPEVHLKEIRRVMKSTGKFYTGMRSKETMLQLPFTKFGFKLYSVEEWSSLLKDNGFTIKNTYQKTDPGFEESGKVIRLESICIAAEL